ncbi:MAG: alpha/beta hydrolase [Candidatus Poseidoniaceae archaeon]|nr:alpha/beta hydrolase [Candidatus Poseidoniaceae archaeon]
MINQSKYGRFVIFLILLLITCTIRLMGNYSQLADVVFSLLLGALLINLFIEYIIIQIFRKPDFQKASIEIEPWVELIADCRGVEARAMLNRRDQSAPLLLMIHGWKSSAESVRERAEWFCEQGWHALIVEMPGHGRAMSVEKWTAIRVIEHTVELMDSLDSLLPSENITEIVYYGHSMGGFVGLNLSKRIDNYSWGNKIKGWILESPMTKYSMVYEESLMHNRIPQFLHPSIQRRLLVQFSALHPQEKPIHSLIELDVPIWGMPQQPTLILQAEEDSVLGRSHYDLLVSSMIDAGREEILTTHLIKDLPHSSARINSTRNHHIEQWLEKNF